jgi:molybdopterin molybdotransferase
LTLSLKAGVLPFFGLPGNPISSAATFLLFAAPVLRALAGEREIDPRFVLAELTKDTDQQGKPGLTRFLPARCEFYPPGNRRPQVSTVPWHGSGDLPAFARSNCFVVVPDEASRLEAGAIVRILLP